MVKENFMFFLQVINATIIGKKQILKADTFTLSKIMSAFNMPNLFSPLCAILMMNSSFSAIVYTLLEPSLCTL